MNEIILTRPHKLDDQLQHDPNQVTYVAQDLRASELSGELHLVMFQIPVDSQFSLDEWVQGDASIALIFDEHIEHTVTTIDGQKVHYLIAQAVAIGFVPPF
jgi:hypothetical protein